MNREEFENSIKKLYFDESKHSVYQSLPSFIVKDLEMNIEIDDEWRGDKVRLDYIEENVDFRNVNSIMDVGANTGYFVLSLAHEYNLDAIAYEGNKNQ